MISTSEPDSSTGTLPTTFRAGPVFCTEATEAFGGLPGQPAYAGDLTKACAAAAKLLPRGAIPTDTGELAALAQREIPTLLEAATRVERLKKPRLQGLSSSLRQLAAEYQHLVTPGIPAAAAQTARERIPVVRAQVRLAAHDARVPTCALR